MPKKIVATVALAIAVAAGCSTKSTSTHSSTTGSGPATSAPAPTSTTALTGANTASAPGVTATTIRLGITYVDLAAIRNVVNIDHGDYQTAYTAVINDINAHGGVNGRTIVPYFAPVNPIGTAPAAAACTKLTEDDKVFAVVGFFNGGDPLCYLVTHGVPIIGGSDATLSAAQHQQEKATWFNYLLSDDHLIPKELDVFSQQNVFAGHKVAVVGLAQDQSEVQNLVLPELHKLGVNVVQTAINDAPPTDTTAAYQQYGLIAQKFQTVGVDVVVAAGSGASQSWPKSLQVNRSSYHPRLVATVLNSLEAYVADKGGYDPAILQGTIAGNGQVPAYASWQDAGMQHCLAVIEAAHPSEPVLTPTPANINSQPNSWVSAQISCATVTLFAAIAKAAGPNLTYDTFLRAGESLTNLTLPGSGAPGPLNFGPGHHDGNGPVVVYTWNAGTKTFDISVPS